MSNKPFSQLVILLLVCACLLCVLASFYMVINHVHGWGWFLVVGVILVGGIRLDKNDFT